jgi:hypothetical protein
MVEQARSRKRVRQVEARHPANLPEGYHAAPGTALLARLRPVAGLGLVHDTSTRISRSRAASPSRA